MYVKMASDVTVFNSNSVQKHKTETIKRVMEEVKGFKTAKKKLSQGCFHLTGILDVNGKNTTNRDRIVE